MNRVFYHEQIDFKVHIRLVYVAYRYVIIWRQKPSYSPNRVLDFVFSTFTGFVRFKCFLTRSFNHF